MTKGDACEGDTGSSHARTEGAGTETMTRLKDLVREHRVCWEVLPEQFPVEGGRPLQVGFNVMLYGAHGHDTDRPLPGCEQCRLIFVHLREIAEWIVPKVERLSRYEIEIFDRSVRYDPARGNRPDVTVTIRSCIVRNSMSQSISARYSASVRWR